MSPLKHNDTEQLVHIAHLCSGGGGCPAQTVAGARLPAAGSHQRHLAQARDARVLHAARGSGE